jgi:hypothetical protein
LQADPSKDSSDEVQNALQDAVDESARLLPAQPVPVNWMIWWKWEVLESWVDGSADWADNRVGLALGCIKADLQGMINNLS